MSKCLVCARLASSGPKTCGKDHSIFGVFSRQRHRIRHLVWDQSIDAGLFEYNACYSNKTSGHMVYHNSFAQLRVFKARNFSSARLDHMTAPAVSCVDDTLLALLRGHPAPMDLPLPAMHCLHACTT